MPWLVDDDAHVLASAEVADARPARRRGLLGHQHYEGALVLRPCRWVHTIGMRFPVDVAYLDADLKVIDTVTMRRYRIGRPRMASRCVIEAEAGRLARWGIEVGDTLDIKE